MATEPSDLDPELLEQSGPEEQGLELPASPDVSSHAHARAEKPSVEQRISHIMGLMERLEWERGKMCGALAERWGLSKATVEGNAAEASRRIHIDVDELKRDITLGARKLLRDAFENGDTKAFELMGKLIGDIAGARAPAKQHVEVSGTLGDLLSLGLDSSSEKAGS